MSVLPTTPHQLRVVLLLSALGRGGAQRQVVVTAAALHRRGHDVTVVTFRSGGALVGDVQASGVDLVQLGGGGVIRGSVARLRLLRLAAVRRADVVYSFMPAANVTASVLGLVRRKLIVVWSIRDSGLDRGQYGRLSRLMHWFADRLSGRPQRIVCNSTVALEHYARLGYPIDRMTVIPNGIDVDRFAPDPASRQRTRQDLGYADADDVVLCLARADPMKGHDDLLHAFSIVATRRPNAHLLLVGDHDDDFAGRVDRLASSGAFADRCTLLPGTDEPESMLRASDLLVLPSRFGEGFPNVIGEAMACGVAVVTTDVGDSQLVVGEEGHVVPPCDPEALADAICSALSERSAPSGGRRARICREFSIERLAQRTEQALHDARRVQ